MFFILAALMASQKSVRDRVFEFSLGLKAATSDNRQFDLLPVIFFVIFLVGAVPLIYYTYNAAMADYYHHQALVMAGRSGQSTYENLQRAERLNPRIDLYRVDLAQTNFALANAIVAQRGPSQASAAGSLSDQDRKTVQTLLSQSISEARAAVALAPQSSRNREVLGTIYRNITGVAQNAFAYSLDSYGRAIQLDPLNPALRLSVGGIYYSVKNYDLAIRFFSDAANLKPDYPNAYFNLAVALKDKGDLRNAQVAAEKVVSLLQDTPESANYKAAANYLASLKAIAATSSATTADNTTAPAAQTNSALDNQSVPGLTVPDLNNPPQVATPAAIQVNPNATVPTPSGAPAVEPSPTPAQ
jgi:tetratricopeptide (TPR) repeat protein